MIKTKQLLHLVLVCLVSCKSTTVEQPIVAEKPAVVSVDMTDDELKEKLENLRMKDQTLRLVLPEVDAKFGVGSEEHTYYWSLIHEQDSINEQEVLDIIDKYGWLGVNRVGELANQSIWLVIQHAPIETQEFYLHHLKKSVEQGESEGWYLAFLEDRILVRNGKDQVYGTQTLYNHESKKYHIQPIGDAESVNERRKKLGMEPIEEFVESNGYVLDQQVAKESNKN